MLWLIAGTTAARIALAAASGLGMDESYMVSAGRAAGLGYFDHPPASWWLSWLAATLADTEAALVVRLPFIALFALSTWLMFRLGQAIATPPDATLGDATPPDATLGTATLGAGFWAAVALNLSPVFGVTTGTWVLPDGPLMCALLGAALCLVHAIRPGEGGEAPRLWWAGAGVCAGLALFAKYSAVLTIGGAVVFLLMDAMARPRASAAPARGCAAGKASAGPWKDAATPPQRPWLLQWDPYLAGLLAVLVFSPVILWNATHDWASFAFQGERAAGLRFRPAGPFEVLAGGALFVLPWLWAPMVWLGGVALWRGPRAHRLLACLAAPPILGFALVAAWSGHRVLFHWAAPGYLLLFPLLGQAIAERIGLGWVRWGLGGTVALVVAGVTVIGVQTRFDPLGPVLASLGTKDPTAEGVDWTSLRHDLAERGLLGPGVLVGLANWRDGGKIARGLGPDVAVVVLNTDARQFGLAAPAAAAVGSDMLVLVASNPEQTAAALAPLFARFERLPDAQLTLAGRVLRPIAVFRAERLLRWPP